ncbi:MAG: peptidoglycan-binding protein LysM [Acidimicrobiia bacterium]|nr:peptidoglycan-binding protein LysM [Acidimicrobiia bacterium]
MEAARTKRAAEEAEARAAAEEEQAERRANRKARKTENKLEGKKSRELERYVKKLGLHAEELDIRYDDGTAYVDGVVADQQDKERIILAVGNVEGVAKVDEDIEVLDEDASAERGGGKKGKKAKMYTVKKGDTLSQIAKEFYGDAMRYPEIFEANRPMLKDPDLIYPGQVLRIPRA